MYSILLFSK